MSDISPTQLPQAPSGLGRDLGALAHGDQILVSRLTKDRRVEFDGDNVMPLKYATDSGKVLQVNSSGSPAWTAPSGQWKSVEILRSSTPLKLKMRHSVKEDFRDFLAIALEVASPYNLFRRRQMLPAAGFAGVAGNRRAQALYEFDVSTQGWASLRVTNVKEFMLDGAISGPSGHFGLDIYAVVGLKWA